MIPVERLQSHLRGSAKQRYESQPVPPFTVFIHPTDDLTYFNYAIPDEPIAERPDPLPDELARPLCSLIEAFGARGRAPRFEYLREYAPGLGASLARAGFAREAHQQFMVCMPLDARLAPDVPGLAIEILDRGATLEQARVFLGTQRKGFDPENEVEIDADEAARWLGEIGNETLLLARLGREPVGAGMLMSPVDGIVELAGLATLLPYRQRGVASAMASHALRTAFARGLEAVCLTAENERAGRIYARVGFRPAATACAWIKRS